MPLPKQTIDVPFGYGIDQKTDEKNVLPGKLIELENGYFDKQGRVSKRPGLAPITVQPSGAAIANASGTIYADDSQITIRTDAPTTNFQSGQLVSQAGLTSLVENAVFTRLESDTLAPNLGSVVNVDGVINETSGFGMYVTNCTSPIGVQLGAFDGETKRQLSSSINPITGIRVRMTQANNANEFFLGAVIGGSLNIFKVGLNTAGEIVKIAGGVLWSSSPAADFNAGATAAWDWSISSNGQTLYLVTTTSAPLITIHKVTVATWAFTTTTIVPAVAASGAGIYFDSANFVGVVWNTATSFLFRGYDANLTALAAVVTLSTSANYDLCTIASANASGQCLVAAQGYPTATTNDSWNRFVEWSAITTTGTGFVSKRINSGALGGKITDLTIPMLHGSSLQGTLFFVRVDPDTGRNYLQGRILYGKCFAFSHSAATIPSSQKLTLNGVTREASIFTMQKASLQENAAGYSGGGVIFETPCWVQARYPTIKNLVHGPSPYPTTIFQGRTVFGGGYLHRIISGKCEVNGFLLYPEIVSAVGSAGGSLAAGTYSVVCTYWRVADNGDVWESDSSPPISVTVTLNQKIDVVLQTYRIDPTITTYAVVYIAPIGSTTYYRAFKTTLAATAGTATVSALTVSTSSPILYTLGAAGNTQPDAPLALCADQDRMWIVPGSARNQVHPSQPYLNGLGLSFFPEVYRQIAGDSGGIVALVRQDSKVFALTLNDTHYASGAGPEANGNNDDLGEFIELFNNIGAESCTSVVRASTGFYVKGNPDLWFIDRSLQPSRVGADVEDILSRVYEAGSPKLLVSSFYYEAERQTRFLFVAMAAGTDAWSAFELVHDEETQQWAYFTRPYPSAASATSAKIAGARFNGLPHYLVPVQGGSGTLATLCRESAAVSYDNEVANVFSLKVVTAWLKPSQALQSYGRIYRALLVGQNGAQNTIQVRVRYDYETTWSETHTITYANATAGNTTWQPEIRFTRQKCESFQLEITDLTPNATSTDFKLSGLELLVGVKPGTNRQSAAKRF